MLLQEKFYSGRLNDKGELEKLKIDGEKSH